MHKQMQCSSCDKTIKGSFCVTQISHCCPETEVVVKMGNMEYKSDKANIEKFVEDSKDMFNFFSGVFCEEIEVSAPDAHVIVYYKDLDDEGQEVHQVA